MIQFKSVQNMMLWLQHENKVSAIEILEVSLHIFLEVNYTLWVFILCLVFFCCHGNKLLVKHIYYLGIEYLYIYVRIYVIYIYIYIYRERERE